VQGRYGYCWRVFLDRKQVRCVYCYVESYGSLGMSTPDFTNGVLLIEDYEKRQLELLERAWNHIIKERNRRYLADHYGEIISTLLKPDSVRTSTKEANVVIYERRFDDFKVVGTSVGRAWINVVVNWKTRRVLTVYTSPHERTQGSVVWPKSEE